MKDIGIYVHIPFCKHKCYYCDFISYANKESLVERYINVLIREITDVATGNRLDYENGIDELFNVNTIYIGGGTPSFIESKYIVNIISTIKEYFKINENAEITLEVNPGTVNENKLKDYFNAGVNRLSIGLQATNDSLLKEIGRIHTYEDFRTSYDLVREAGFENVNVDLMSGLPGQSLEQWLNSLRVTTDLMPEHISAYSLMIEEGTPFFAKYRDQSSLPDEETERQMYEQTKVLLRERGLYRYEISNYAKPGFECRHNIGYWRRREYLGLGLGASSFFQGRRWRNTDSFAEYLRDSRDRKKIRREEEVLTRQDSMEEFMFLGLRMCEGVSEGEFMKEFKVDMESVYGAAIDKLEKGGLLQRTGERIALTEKGINLSNPVLAEFLLD